MRRNKGLYLFLTMLVMILGLLSRKINSLPYILDKYSGDCLWALMIFLLFIFIFNKRSTIFVGVLALIFSYGIELSQLYHAPWIDSIRDTTLGGLVLGFGFLWSDILCYTIGIGIGMVVDIIISIGLKKKCIIEKNSI